MTQAEKDLARAQELKDLKELLALPAFLRYSVRQFKDFNLFAPTWTGDARTFANAAKRDAIITYFRDIQEVNPTVVATIMRELLPRKDQ